MLPAFGLLGAAVAASTGEVEFNCPWCNTRLALTKSDFQSERAVLCPRCSNPIDLDIQRRLSRTQRQPPGAPPRKGAPPQKPAPPAPTAPLPRPEMPTAPLPAPRREQPGTAMQYNPSNAPGTATGMDWSKPVDIDSTFSGVERPAAPDLSSAAGSKPVVKGAPGTPFGNKLHCPACGYENARVPPEFSFGTTAKCAWCNKELPQ